MKIIKWIGRTVLSLAAMVLILTIFANQVIELVNNML